MKVKINSRFKAFWGPKTPKEGDVVRAVMKEQRGYWVVLDESEEPYLVLKDEADLVEE